MVKVASGFPGNAALDLSTSSGAMLLFSQRTGHLQGVLNDEGWLTDLRTAAAGAVAARYLAPKAVTAIGLVGTGMQARFQASLLKHVTSCRRVVLWGRTESKIAACRDDLERDGFTVTTTTDVNAVVEQCNLIVTTTSARAPLITRAFLPGTHVTAMGSDGLGKQEIDGAVVAAVQREGGLLVADSKAQCLAFGEISHAVAAGEGAGAGAAVDETLVIELGDLINRPELHRGGGPGGDDDMRVTIFDSTGVAAQGMRREERGRIVVAGRPRLVEGWWVEEGGYNRRR